MKILKYKKGAKGLYKITLEDGTVLSLYEEVILKYNLLLTKRVDDEIKDEMFACNLEYEVYYAALNSIKSRNKSEYDLRKYLLNKEYPIDLIDKAVNKLIEQGYLNDRFYTKCFISNQMITSVHGPLKIEKELLDKKIDSQIICEELEVFTEEEQLLKVDKIIRRIIRSNRSRGGLVLKQKIFNDLKNYGYEISIINKVIDEYDYNAGEDDIAKKEYEKLYVKYSRKYSGVELNRKIKEKLYLKGLKYNQNEND